MVFPTIGGDAAHAIHSAGESTMRPYHDIGVERFVPVDQTIAQVKEVENNGSSGTTSSHRT